MIWKLLERFGVLGVQFILQIVLARLLSPEHYGVLSIMIIFTQLANIFIQTGFNTALIQNKDVTDEDYSSVFWVTLLIATAIYGILFLAAPFIADFYALDDFTAPFRVLCLILFPGALNSIQLAKVSKELDFKQVFFSNLSSIIISGVVGIILALVGAGIWALVAQSFLNIAIASIVMLFTVKWYPKFICKISRVKILFAYGWKLLVSGLLDTLYQNIQSLVIGKKYDTGTLGYYNRGQQFPQFIISAINSSVQSVLLPTLSAEQDNISKVKTLTRNSVMLSSYIIFPMMAGLAGVATPLVKLLLTDKWLPCVPFLQINCITFAFYPVHTSNLQAINAVGRSDIFLKLEIAKKFISLFILAIAVFGFDSPIAIALSGAIGVPIGFLINAFPNNKLINYSYFEQIKDIFPSLIASVLMFTFVILMQNLPFATFLTLIIQILSGILFYILISAIFKLTPFQILLNIIKNRSLSTINK